MEGPSNHPLTAALPKQRENNEGSRSIKASQAAQKIISK
jgi:hypothetical protein